MVEFINMQYHEMYLTDKVTAAASICRDKLNADPSTSGDTQCWLAALLRLIFLSFFLLSIASIYLDKEMKQFKRR